MIGNSRPEDRIKSDKYLPSQQVNSPFARYIRVHLLSMEHALKFQERMLTTRRDRLTETMISP